MLTCIHLQKYYTSKCYAPLCHNWSDMLTHMPMLNVTTSTNMPCKVQSSTTSKAATRDLPFLPAKLFLSSITPGTFSSLPLSSTKPIMVHTGPSHWWWAGQMCSWPHLRTSSGCCQARHIQHWQCSTNCIYISSCHPGSDTTNSCGTHSTNTSCTSSQQLHCKLHAKFCMQDIYHNEHRCYPLEALWARPAWPLLSYIDQLKAGSHHPGFLKRYRHRLSLSGEPDDAMTWNVPSKPMKFCTLN